MAIKKTPALIAVILIIVGAFFLWQEYAPASAPNNSLSASTDPTEACNGSYNGRYYQVYNESAREAALEISSTMKSENSELADYFDQGYVLRDACIDSNTGLLFFDFSAGLKSNYNTVSESELAELGKQVLLGVSDAEYNNVNIYPATLPDSFLCYIGDTCTTCSLDTLTNDNILFQCRNSNNGYRHYAWYAHNTETGESTTVKEVTESWVYGGIISPEEERESYQKKEKIYHEDYLELFRNKTADLKY